MTEFSVDINNKPITLVTDIPIFNMDEEGAQASVNAYLQNGDVSGAANSDFIEMTKDNYSVGNVNSSSEFEQPKINAVKTFDSNSDDVFAPRRGMAVTINSSGSLIEAHPNLTFDVQVGAVVTTREGKTATLPYKYFNLGMKFTGSYTLNDLYLWNDVRKWINQSSYIETVDKLIVRVRFRDDKEASSWVQVVFSNGSPAVAFSQDNNGNYVEGDYNGELLPGDTSSGYSGGFLVENVTFFLDYIKSGFGLLDGGLISLMSSTFRYIPASIWDLFKSYISAVVIITMIVLIIRAVSAVASAIGSIFSKGGA